MKPVLIALICLILSPIEALADIELSPLRNVLTDQNREVIFSVSNPTKRIIEGRVGWLDFSATATGYVLADAGTRQQLSAAPYLSVHPAQFRLKPGERIDIVVKLRDGITPPPGERRSHLLIETAAARTLIRKTSTGLQPDIGAGVSAPVMIRGTGKASASIGETKLLRDDEGMLLLSATVNPAGDHSTFGRLIASFDPDDPTKPSSVLGERANVTGYPDAKERLVEIPFGFFSLGAGVLTLRYEGDGEFAGRLFDERSFDIAPPK